MHSLGYLEMLISIDQQTYINLSNKNCLESVNQFWNACTEKWFAKQSRMVSLYIQEQQAKEEAINRVISERSNNTTPELLPPPTEKQKQIQKFYLTNWEGTPTTYHFYDTSTGKPTYARWLRKFLDKWDVKLNDPFGEEIVEHRSLKGSIRKGKPEDPILEYYLRNRDDIHKVLTYCQNIDDLTVMEATSNIGGHRGPFGEFASAADKALKDKIKKQKASRDGKLTPEDQYDLLVNCSSKFFLTMNGLKTAFEVFSIAFKKAILVDADEVNLQNEHQVDTDLLSPCIEQYCKAMKSTIERAIKFKKLLQEQFENKYKDINTLKRQLFEIIITLNERINFLINLKLAEVQPENYQPGLDVSPNSIAKVELPLSDDKLTMLLQEQAQNDILAQNAKEVSSLVSIKKANVVPPSTPLASSSAPAAATTPPDPSSRRSSSSRRKKRQHEDNLLPVTPITKTSSSLHALVSPRGEMSSSAHGERSSSAFASTTREAVDFTPGREKKLRPRDEFFNNPEHRTGSPAGTPRRQASTSRIDRSSSGKSILEQAAAGLVKK